MHIGAATGEAPAHWLACLVQQHHPAALQDEQSSSHQAWQAPRRTIVQRRQLDVGRGGAGAKHQRRARCQAQQQACTPLLLLLAALLGGCRATGGVSVADLARKRGFRLERHQSPYRCSPLQTTIDFRDLVGADRAAEKGETRACSARAILAAAGVI